MDIETLPATPEEADESVPAGARGTRCPLTAFSQAAGGKYKMRILWDLMQGPMRYGELRRSAIVAAMGKPITPRILSRELREMEDRGLIDRHQFPGLPLRVEYSLTDFGRSLLPVIEGIVRWGLAATSRDRGSR